MSTTVKYSTFRYPCLDKYKPGSGFVSNIQISQIADHHLSTQGLQSSSTNRSKLQLKAFKKLKAAFKVSAIWDTKKYPVIKVHFLDGSQKQKDWVKYMVMKDIAPLVTQFSWDWDASVNDAMVRVSFALPGQAWSFVGTDALEIPIPQPTMNLGWLDDDETYNNSEIHKNTGQVVLHEFGHMLGMIHEHTNPKGNPIIWNRDVVYAELKRTNGWDPDQVDHNMFEKYSDIELCDAAKTITDEVKKEEAMQNACSGTLVNGSEYDVHSIMHYWYPSSWILQGPTEIPVNLVLSDKDKEWLTKYYGVVQTIAPTTITTSTTSTDVVTTVPPTQNQLINKAIELLESLIRSSDIDDNTEKVLHEIKTNIEGANCLCDTSQDIADPQFGIYIIYFVLLLLFLCCLMFIFSKTTSDTKIPVSQKI